MNSQAIERLYHLLPAIYRQRDAAQGEPLRALLAVMETELQAIETDIEGLYENWFIETCEEWVVPYIADLLGIRSLSDQESTRLSHRAYVANTIAYRRRKGIPAILESITLDVTGWRSRLVECFERVSVTQQVNHIRPGKGSTFDIRSNTALNPFNSPFDPFAYTVDVRRIASEYSIRGQTNILNLGLFVWRLQSYPIKNSPAAIVQEGRYTVHPLGRDMPLFNRPQTKTEITQRTEVIHLPCPLSVEALAADLQEYKIRYQGTDANQRPPNSTFYGPDRSFHFIHNGQPVPSINLVSCHLDSWQPPILEPGQIAIDVQRGRFVVPPAGDNAQPPALEVSYCYGFSGDLGGGPYDRHQTLANRNAPGTKVQMIAGDAPFTLPSQAGRLAAALNTWYAPDQPMGIIQMTDNGIYGSSESPLTLTLPESSRLTLEAADGTRPVLQSTDFAVEATGTGASLTLNGLLLKGSLTLRGKLNLSLIHCTVLGGIKADPGVDLQVTIAHSIVGSIRMSGEQVRLTIQDSIVDSATDAATIAEKSAAFAIAAPDTDAPGAQATIERTTVFGRVKLSELPIASNAIFTAPVTVQRQHPGSLRFSYVPTDSATPLRYRCQPDLKLSSLPQESQEQERDRVVLSLTPRFTAVTYGEPGYAQLDQSCAQEISAGADDGSEMGAFHLLHQPQRKAYLHLNLVEYVRSGLEIGVFYIT